MQGKEGGLFGMPPLSNSEDVLPKDSKVKSFWINDSEGAITMGELTKLPNIADNFKS